MGPIMTLAMFEFGTCRAHVHGGILTLFSYFLMPDVVLHVKNAHGSQ